MGKNYFSATPFFTFSQKCNRSHNAYNGFVGYQKKRIEPLIQKKKFDQIGHAVVELSLIEKLLTGVFGRRWSPFSKIIFLNIFRWIRKVLSQLDQRNLVCSNRMNE